MCLALFSVNCWPSDNGQGGCDVNIEYELEQDQLELQDVVITIPIPWVCLSVWYIFSYIEVSIYFSYCSHGSGSPVVAECDGEYTFEKRCNELLWQLPLIDANNKTGSMEFSSSGTPDDFFPVQVAFFSKKSYSGLEVWSIIHLKCSWIGTHRNLISGAWLLRSGKWGRCETFYRMHPFGRPLRNSVVAYVCKGVFPLLFHFFILYSTIFKKKKRKLKMATKNDDVEEIILAEESQLQIQPSFFL